MHLILSLLLALSTPALAGELAGVTMADSQTVAGQQLVLNGMGLREKFFIDVYVGGLYLPASTTDFSSAINSDVPKQIRMHFIYHSVPAAKMVDTYEEGFDATLRLGIDAEIDQFLGWMEDLTTGDEMILTYVPGTGTTVTIKGHEKGTIANPQFMKLVFTNYIGPNANRQLRQGMLGL